MTTSLAVLGSLAVVVVWRASYCGVYCGGGGRKATDRMLAVAKMPLEARCASLLRPTFSRMDGD